MVRSFFETAYLVTGSSHAATVAVLAAARV
jgi:hypothetical protein